MLATILAPTDAILAQAVVSSSRVPVCIRQAINVESALETVPKINIKLSSTAS